MSTSSPQIKSSAAKAGLQFRLIGPNYYWVALLNRQDPTQSYLLLLLTTPFQVCFSLKLQEWAGRQLGLYYQLKVDCSCCSCDENGDKNVVAETRSAFCNCALSGGKSWVAARRSAKQEGDGWKESAVKWGKREEANKCVGVYWAASETPWSTII